MTAIPLDQIVAQDYQQLAEKALEHIDALAEAIGPRPSTGEGERAAAQYAAQVLKDAGLEQVRLETFQSGRSTYRPFLVAFGAAMASNINTLVRPYRCSSMAAVLAHGAAAWAFAREAGLKPNWTRRVQPVGDSQNVIGIVPAKGEARRRVVVYGHLDSHRTPLVYSSPKWLKIFQMLVAAGFISLAALALLHGLRALTGRPSNRLQKFLAALHLLGMAVQGFCMALLAQADTTPYSAGANDNASGAATMLALAEYAAKNPLPHTELWFAGTGCEEVGAYGIGALLDAHSDELRDAFFIDFDMVGIGSPSLLTKEGLLQPSRPDEELLNLAREVARENPGLIAGEHEGGAYTDTGMVTQKGFRGLTIDSQIPQGHPAQAHMGYWHQQKDTLDKIEVECLAKTVEFGWKLLRKIDALN